jgi:hypothetical protein
MTDLEVSYLSYLEIKFIEVIRNHLFSSYFFSFSYVPGILLAAGITTSKKTDKILKFMETEFLGITFQ